LEGILSTTDDPYLTLIEKVEALQTALKAAATNDPGDTSAYAPLRRELMRDPVVGPRLPEFVRRYPDLEQFWPFIKDKFPTYGERREFIWDAFRPILDVLSGLNTHPPAKYAARNQMNVKTVSKKDRLRAVIEDVRTFRFCGPSDDPDEQTAVTTGYHYLVTQIQRLAAPLLPEADAVLLKSITVDIDSIYTAYNARAELDALLPDIEAALEQADESTLKIGGNTWIVAPDLIERLSAARSSKLDLTCLVRMCREINSSVSHGNIVATALLMRAVLNYVPPVFGHETFPQVLANIGRSLKESFDHLENGLRKIADFHTHRRIGATDSYPSIAQVEPFKPQFELLLHEVSNRV
jgi:hypothetical protein